MGVKKGRSRVCSFVIANSTVRYRKDYVRRIKCPKSLQVYNLNRISLRSTMIVQSHEFDWCLKVFLYLHY